MTEIDATPAPAPRRRPARARTTWMAAVLLAGGLTLTGCSTTSTDTATSSTASSSTSSSITDAAAASTTDATTTAQTISDTAAAAEAFLATLSEEQREAVLYAYDDETKTTSWSNFPVTFVERAGLNLTDLTAEQQSAALAVLEALLSDEAYQTVTAIMGGDEYLLENSNSTEESLGQYYIAFFGDPSTTSSFEVQFGGHHLGINATLDGTSDAITFAPTHLGVQPAVYTDADGNEVQPFDGIYTDAFAFFDSLTAEQQATLTSGEVSSCAPGDTCDFATGTGLTGAELTEEQKQLLLELIANWAGMADEESTATTLAQIEVTLDDTVVAWSGETTYDMSTGDGISFSISGPNVYVSFQAQNGSAGADVDGVTTSGWGHVHTIYRDPTNDYAGSVTQQAAFGMGGGAAPGGAAPGGAAPGGAAPGGAPSGE
ncbi:DUF3500 domain-containing protein [Paenibacillus sp. TRM 82003]|uniref:DUF3500 domain-containing protein n=1 Tax=Kineococcus sp. TRM81007 TaxID=2925831 RepID=UPI001F5954BE|nr:DUF3500 domain-containing protein [Kineococcus sp. TRM81007]MCI2237243.1 DUF3500 domain-containing protein [Kineococcus sp. TRM81007]MCI3919794.1 DUF3500 domain-containing protein [Paenibacillus sp. TRM 82003]